MTAREILSPIPKTSLQSISVVGLTPEKALIFRITHIENIPWILQNGLHCRNSGRFDPNYRDIGNPDLIGKRAHRVVPIDPGGTLSDYIPFYFTPYSPMLLNIRTGYGGLQKTPMSEIVILVSSLRKISDSGVPFLFTDRHAYLQAAEFSSDLNSLDRVEWDLLQERDFSRDPEDPSKFEKYQAEALIHGSMPVGMLSDIACHGPNQAAQLGPHLEDAKLKIQVIVRPKWYF